MISKKYLKHMVISLEILERLRERSRALRKQEELRSGRKGRVF
jgi:hypothetical protein